VFSNYFDQAVLQGIQVTLGILSLVPDQFGDIAIGPSVYLENDRPNSPQEIAVLGQEISHTVQQVAYGDHFWVSYGIQGAMAWFRDDPAVSTTRSISSSSVLMPSKKYSPI
jgi:hypothetical protein